VTSSIIDKEEKLEYDTIIFRIDQDIVNELRQESKQKKGSLNILVNQILGFYVKRYKPSQIAADIPISKRLGALLLSYNYT
jgi:hypothetical protein